MRITASTERMASSPKEDQCHNSPGRILIPTQVHARDARLPWPAPEVTASRYASSPHKPWPSRASSTSAGAVQTQGAVSFYRGRLEGAVRRAPPPRSMRYLRFSIHLASACEPRPSVASIAALNPRNACSLDMTPLVRGCSARSARKPLTAWVKPPMLTRMSARCFAKIRCSSRLFTWPHGLTRTSAEARRSPAAGAGGGLPPLGPHVRFSRPPG